MPEAHVRLRLRRREIGERIGEYGVWWKFCQSIFGTMSSIGCVMG
jgi:hypothetical protein